jgi:hypothetical protein
MLCLVATATGLELPPIGEVAESDVVPMHRVPCVGPEWRFRSSSDPRICRDGRKAPAWRDEQWSPRDGSSRVSTRRRLHLPGPCG